MTLSHHLAWNHYLKILPLKEIGEINYYINVTIRDNLSIRALAERIKSDEYGRLSLETKIKLKESKEVNEKEMLPDTILVPSSKLKEELTEKVLENLIIDNICYVMKQLGEGYSFLDKQYKINIGNNMNYIDILIGLIYSRILTLF